MVKMQKLKATKLPVIENKALKGGLKDTLQRYSIYYLYPITDNGTILYHPKVSVEHFIEKPNITTRPLSIRFQNPLLLKEFILELSQAYAVFQKNMHPNLTPYSNGGYIFHKNNLLELLRGINDNYKMGLTK